jgi:hypothetical protein
VKARGTPWWRQRPWLVTVLLLMLALAAVLIPEAPLLSEDGTLLVLLPEPDPRRQDALAELAVYLGRQAHLDLRLQIVTERSAFVAALPGALAVLCPDAVGLGLPMAQWQAVAAGRRRAPWNLRPVSVLVSRRGAATSDAPWRTHPMRTVFGDSLSLACLVPLCTEGGLQQPPGVSWGSDPYDHRAVLEACRHGAFDHAVVRQWDAEAALAAGGLDPAVWSLRRLSDPVPDVVVLVARQLPGAVRLDLQEALTMLGRDLADEVCENRLVRAQLGHFGLDGFNLLLGPDFERLRRLHGRCWPGAVD